MSPIAATFRTRVCTGALVLAAVLPCVAGERLSWTFANPTRTAYENEPVRLNIVLPDTAKQGDYVARADGNEVPCQIEEVDGYMYAWVLATVQPYQKIEYTLEPGKPAAFEPKVTVREEDGNCVLDNGTIAVRIPARADGKSVPGPIERVRMPDGKWVGGSFWETGMTLRRFSASVTRNGPIFAKARLRYEFDGRAGIAGDEPAFAQVDVALYPGDRHLTVGESHAMRRDDFWEFDCTAGWDGRKPMCSIFQGDPGHGPDPAAWPKDLKPLGVSDDAIAERYRLKLSRVGPTLLWLVPRWNQGYWDGWVFTVSDASQSLGAVVGRAGKWVWPHDNKIEVRARDSGDYAGLRCPTFRGARHWFLIAAPADFDARAFAHKRAHFPLDKLVNDIVSDWPGKEYAGGKDGSFWMLDPYDSNQINPTGAGRRMNRTSPEMLGKKGNLTHLTQVQVMLHPDTYGSYWDYWSPQNPNFYSDWIRTPTILATALKDHPRFAEIALKAQLAVLADPYFGAALPGGAGQECPGYMGLGHWKGLADIAAQHLEFDIVKWPRIVACRGFTQRLPFPSGDKYVSPPYGDSHGGGKLLDADLDTVKAFSTEELPGFGAIFRENPGTPRETHLSFKSGPNRGHYHGDQLAILYSANRNYLVADHSCSFSPRPGQEHMHNRLAFFTDAYPYLNMDGYERLIAFKKGKAVSVAVGQVESPRLRWVQPLPPEDWHRDWPRVELESPLVYRRTVVHVSDNAQDYFAIRDQYRSPIELGAAYALHPLDNATAALAIVEKDQGADSDGTATIRDEARDFEKLGVRPGWIVNWENPNVPSDLQTRYEVVRVSGNGLTLDKTVPAAAKHPYALLRPLYRRAGNAFVFTNLTLFCAHPGEFGVTFFPWYHGKHGGEGTQGIRLETRGRTGEYVTILYPSAKAPDMTAIPGGVRVGDDEIAFAGGLDEDRDTVYVSVKRRGVPIGNLVGADLDLRRSQGDIGLFIPDAGYPFGPIPDWLVAQRARHPDWYYKLARLDRMRGTDKDMKELLALARDGDPLVRGAALRVFGTKGGDAWVPAFRDLAKDLTDPRETAWAEASLAKLRARRESLK